ncbi:MAG: HlyD family efflux transporter periplasmic adaptor subunit [Woeseiaceae bacterium]|nr:HlyD family efflux transporter periplasmic adaptor subunit [Woeseiaceae bacterium]
MQANRSVLLAALAFTIAGCNGGEDPGRVVGELASDRIELTAEVAEPITEIAVDEGVEVSAGTPLVYQDAERARARLSEAEAALAQATARLDELVRGPRREQIDAARANLDGAERDLVFRQAEFERAREVHARELASPESLDRARALLDSAEANVDLRHAQLQEMLAGTTVEELAQAENAVRQAAARRDSTLVDVDRHTIRAPTDGITDVRLFELGERPNPGQPIMVMLGGRQPFARVYVPESMRVRVSTGLAARVYVDGLDEAIDGRVRWVAAEAAFTPYFALTERDRSRLSFVAKVDLVGVEERLPDGVPVEVEFLFGSQ